jgi:hypothetical protein
VSVLWDPFRWWFSEGRLGFGRNVPARSPFVLEFQVKGKTAARFPIDNPEEGRLLARQWADQLETSPEDFCEEHSIPDRFRTMLTP